MIGFITKLMSLTQQTDGKCNEENCQQKSFKTSLHKELKEIIILVTVETITM